MPCFHPNKVFLVGKTRKGEDLYKFTGYGADYVYLVGQSWFAGSGFPRPLGARDEHKVVRCGQCLDCRLARARVMAERGLVELGCHSASMFLTLTYSPECVPLSYPEGGGPYDFSLTLVPLDFTNFMKRLRFHYSSARLRLMACGEYGDENHRPHYHAIVFGLDPTDLKFFTRTDLGDILYTSEILDKIWGLGHVFVGEVTYESLGYVARYILKKQTGEGKEVYERLGIAPPFSRYSNRPGIGGLYLDSVKADLVDSSVIPDILYVSTSRGGKEFSFPRYFLDKLEGDMPDEVSRIKESRFRNAVSNVESIERQLEIPYEDYLAQLERSKSKRIKGLIRSL